MIIAIMNIIAMIIDVGRWDLEVVKEIGLRDYQRVNDY
jgi:hypothetical protein